MAFRAPNPLHQQTKLYSITLCKCTWPLNFFKFHYSPSLLTFSPPKHPLQQSLSPLLEVRTHGGHIVTELSTADQEISNNSLNGGCHIPVASGIANDKRVRRKNAKKNVSSVDEENLEMGATKDGDTGKRVDSRKRSEKSFAFSYLWSKRETIVKSLTENIGSTEDNTERGDKSWKGFGKELGVGKRKKGVKRSKVYSREVILRVGLDRCSKKGDVMGALMLYDSARREGVVMEQYHYTVLLYLCSSAATGDVRPAKSGTVSRSLSNLDPATEVSTLNSEDLVPSDIIDRDYNGLPPQLGNEMGRSFDGKKLAMVYDGDAMPNPQVMDGTIHRGIGDHKIQVIEDGKNPETFDIPVNTSFKDYALLRGFEIFERMCLEEVPINEASLTSVARMYMALRDGDMAFFMVKQMKPRGINPRLRSYGPALSAFCNCGDVDKAFSVEQHMLEHGVYPEEQELEALLKVSVEAGRSDKVYYLLHKLRTSVRKVLPSVVDLLEKWFKSKVASKVGKRKLDERLIREAIENGGGGWHGQGWLGKGKWNVLCTFVGADGLCKCCGEKLATVDLDPVETEKFAESVASIAEERDKNSSFQRFKKWLDYHGPFEAVVDGANIGVLAKRKLNSSQQARLQMVTKVNAIVNGIRQLLPSKKWPLIVLHTRHITGYNWDKPLVKELIEKWKTAGALYVTPNGLYDDWYWLYAAIKCKGLLVTNDEMRDHLFQLQGNDFFPKWKERHQVRFSFSDAGPVIHMPPPYSVLIQESEKGHWHIPIASEHDNEGERTWLCITRGNSPGSTQVTAAIHEDNHRPGPTKLSATTHDEHNDLAGATQVTGTIHKESQSTVRKRGCESSANPTKIEAKSMLSNHGKQSANGNSKHSPEELYESLINILSTPLSSISKDSTILPQIEAAEKLGRCVIDFEI